MTKETIFENLCIKDSRNPLHADVFGEGCDKPEPRTNCYCDNCFYGRDELALELINLNDASKAVGIIQAESRHSVCDCAGYDCCADHTAENIIERLNNV